MGSKIEWTEVPGFGGYEVSTTGRVRSFRDRHGGCRAHPLDLRGMPNADGYLYVLIGPHCGARHRKRFIHRMVLEAFVGPCPDGMESRHLDGDNQNNVVGNLRWGTRREQAADRKSHGTELLGADKPGAVLNDDQIQQIRDDQRSSRVVGREFAVSHTTIQKIRRREKWSHIK